MSEPLATIRLHHSTLELWPDSVRTIFHADGAEVPAAPNGGETVVDTAVHEALHAIIAQVKDDKPSECLRGVADGDGKRWTDGRRAEESLVYGLTPLVVQLIDAVASAYRDPDRERAAVSQVSRSDVLRVAALRRTLKDLQEQFPSPFVGAAVESALDWDARAARGEFIWADEPAEADR